MLRNYELSWDTYPKAGHLDNYPSVDYFCIHVLLTPATVSLEDYYSSEQSPQNHPLPDISSIEYSFNKAEWFTYTGPITVNDHVYFRGSPTIQKPFDPEGPIDVPSWSNFGTQSRRFKVNRPFYVSGKISSLIDKNLTGLVDIPYYGFNRLFAVGAPYADYLYDAQYLLLDYENIAIDHWYYSTEMDGIYAGMFAGCHNLSHAPALNATTLGSYCYSHMFQDCTKLTEIPEIKATKLTEGCFEDMFSGCTSLTKPPKMASSVEVNNQSGAAHPCAIWFVEMFRFCNNLQYAPKLPFITNAVESTVYPWYPAQGIFNQCNIIISDTQSEETPYVFRIPVSGNQQNLPRPIPVINTAGTTPIYMDVNTDYYCNLPYLPD